MILIIGAPKKVPVTLGNPHIQAQGVELLLVGIGSSIRQEHGNYGAGSTIGRGVIKELLEGSRTRHSLLTTT